MCIYIYLHGRPRAYLQVHMDRVASKIPLLVRGIRPYRVA